MKISSIIISLTILICLSSCQSVYYQVYSTKTTNNIVIKDNTLIFEDDNCKVTYDLWANGGNFSFKFFNKTNDNIYIHMDESFYVKNGMANNFFNNRIYSKASSSSYSNSNTASSSNSISGYGSNSKSISVSGYNAYNLSQTNKLIKTNSVGITNNFGVSNTFQTTEGFSNSVTSIEEKIIIVPKKSAKIIYGFYINKNILKFKDLIMRPKNNKPNTIQFTMDNSPVIFNNLISYSLNRDDKLIEIDNNFYVSEISNYDSKNIIEAINKDEDGKFIRPIRYFKVSSPDKFYIKYE